MARTWLVALLALLALPNCRCGDAGGQDAGPPMPSGMLVPTPPSTAGSRDLSGRLALGRSKKGGEWIELQIAGANDAADRKTFDHWQETSRFLSPDAMALLHDAFARASPGLDPFVPRLFDGAALARLRAELGATKTQLLATSTADEARGKWSGAAALDGADWPGARTIMVGTVDELTAWIAEVSGRSERLWLLY